MSVAIIDYGSGNLHSAAKAFERAAHEAGLDQPIVVTRDPDMVSRADRVVLPGVGAFADCRRGLGAVSGMVEALKQAVRGNGRPFFGICVGMQLLAERGREYEVVEGLGWIAGEVDRITPRDAKLKIPHMGWNTLNVLRPHPLVEGLPLGSAGTARLFRALVRAQSVAAAGFDRRRRLWRADHRDCRTRQYRRHAVSSREEPKARAGADCQFFEVEAVILFPAIDLKNGEAVRLQQGDMARATVFSRDPAAQARAFAQQGFTYLHLVDLDGAFAGKPVNATAVERILAALKIPVQLGGGIRDRATIDAWLGKGIARVIIGTAAVRDPALVKDAARAYPGRIAVGLDARDGKVAVEGWSKTSMLSALDVARRFEDAGVAAIVYTDVNRDGMLEGLNLDATIALADKISIPVIASGGLASLADVQALTQPRAQKLEGAIVGRALYDGRLDAAAALALLRAAQATA